MGRTAPHPLRVMQSFPAIRPTTNPYLSQLVESISGECEVFFFSWRRALFGRFDVFHVHWPELLQRGRGPLRDLGRKALTVAFLARLRLSRIPIVRTLHNVSSHEDGGRLERVILRLVEHETRLWIRLNPSTAAPRHGITRTIVHGDYRGHFLGLPRSSAQSGRLACVGLVRRYKGVDHLVSEFSRITDPNLRLHVAGPAHDAPLSAEIEFLAAGDSRISVDLRFLTDAELLRAITEAELIVLPYREMHNSGVVLLALSLDRPVLAPRNDVTVALAEEVGAGWVRLFDGELSHNHLLAALAADPPAETHPDLRQRAWGIIGAQHVDAYLTAACLTVRASHKRGLRDILH